jgi:O-antigen/teichoic acid export membrane protein
MKISNDYISILITNISVKLTALILFKLISVKYGIDDFYHYSYLKRCVGFIIPILFFGTSVNFPKSLALKNDRSDVSKAFSITLIALIIIYLIIFSIAFFFSDFISNYSVYSKNDIWYLVYLTTPLVLSSFIYSYYRGVGNINAGNLTLILHSILIPLMCIFIAKDLYKLVLLSFFISLFFLLIQLMSIKKSLQISHINLLIFKSSINLIVGCSKRVPGEIAFQAIFMMPVLFSLTAMSQDLTGKLSFIMSIIILAGTILVKPVSTLALVKASQINHQGDVNLVILKNLKIGLLVGICVSLGFLFFGIYFLSFFNIKTNLLSTLYMSLSILMLNIYVSIRSILDAFGNGLELTKICTVSLLIFIIVYNLLTLKINQFDSSLLAMIFSLASLNIQTIYRLLKHKVSK